MSRTLDALLDQLREGAEMPSQAVLCHLSGLGPEEVAGVLKVWPHLPNGLRRQLMARLVQMAEADFEMDFGAIFRLGLEDEDAAVRTSSIEGLWEDEDVRLVPLLAVRLKGDEDAPARAAAATSLGRFVLLGELERIRPDPHKLAYESLLTTCQDAGECLEVRRRALESLAYAGEEVVAQLILEAYAGEEEKARVSAVFAMGRSADKRWSGQVRQELSSPNPELRFEAARACGELRLSETVAELGELTEDVDREVQEAALWSLGQIGGEKAKEILQHFLRSGDEATQAAAEAALEELEFLHEDLDFLDRLAEEDGRPRD